MSVPMQRWANDFDQWQSYLASRCPNTLSTAEARAQFRSFVVTHTWSSSSEIETQAFLVRWQEHWERMMGGANADIPRRGPGK